MPNLQAPHGGAVRPIRAFLLTAVGLALIFAGTSFGVQLVRLAYGAVPATGTVVDLVSRRVGAGATTQHAVVRFSADDGRTVQFEDSVGTSPPMYRVGEQIRILYVPGAPEARPLVDHGLTGLLPTLLIGLPGLVCALLGLSLFIHRPGPSPAAGAPASVRGLGLPGAAPGAESAPRHRRALVLVLVALAVALPFAPPSHKTGDAAVGVLLCLLAAVVAVLGALIDIPARVALAGLEAAAATRAGSSRGLDVGDSGADWAAAARDSPRLQALLLRYSHWRSALRTTAILLLLGGDLKMAAESLAYLTHGPH
jgi:hypothetical protein